MRLLSCLVCLMAWFANLGCKGTSSSSDTAGDPDHARFQGRWLAERGTLNGSAAPVKGKAGLNWTFKGTQVIPENDPNDTATIKVDSTKNPREVDFVDKSNKVNLGIYRFVDENTLEICMDTGGRARPKEFSSQPGSNLMLILMKRQKE